MQVVALEQIAKLNSESFLHILQSILQARMGKHSAHAHNWIEAQDFAKLSFSAAHCQIEDIESIAKTLKDMFNLQHIEHNPKAQECFGVFANLMYEAWSNGPRNITFFTSGSTGKPKPCTHPEEHLRQELIGIVPLVKNRKAALVTAPLHHLYGFTFGLLLPMSLNIPLRLVPPMPTIIAHQIRAYDLIISVPLLYSHLARLENLQSKHSFLICGTAPLPAETFAQLLEHDFEMVEFFGSSEMGVMCCRHAPKQHFTLLPQFERIIPKDSSLPDSVRRTLPDGSSKDFALQDNINWQDSRHLLPIGRKDFAVQVAGVNVFPEYVMKVLSEHPCVAGCTVRLMRPEEGQRLKAFIVLKSGYTEEDARKELRAYAKQKLKPVEQPAKLSFGADLPRSAIGKPADW